jgi:hypothetical protein
MAPYDEDNAEDNIQGKKQYRYPNVGVHVDASVNTNGGVSRRISPAQPRLQYQEQRGYYLEQ